ncbi:hypothetical protein [Aminobacter carboxidus]|uniref:Uncharacterized protein n=1 Tax=Aminobacter carboxidus TaxID=376165 RepID=A0ABR9GWR5_9HYPH|nr:hypothetical protein [Aminobacter carboxidus]MBE1208119.1 hypothetical protein [Aminobacter carboxidus]
MVDEPKNRGGDVADIARLVVALVGSALVGVGGWLHYPPLGFAASGLMLFTIAVLGTVRAR